MQNMIIQFHHMTVPLTTDFFECVLCCKSFPNLRKSIAIQIDSINQAFEIYTKSIKFQTLTLKNYKKINIKRTESVGFEFMFCISHCETPVLILV